MTDHIVTGATGFVGSHLVADLLADDTTGRVIALARGNRLHTPEDRVYRALENAGHDAGHHQERMTVVQSELTEQLCGVNPDDVRRGDGPLIFWHVAASLQWRRGQRERVLRTNVEGTRNALQLARRIGVDLYVHISTAYTCGSLYGDLPEQLHRPDGFNNVYEESKNAAEHLVAGCEGLRTLILRPAVVVGTSQDYRPSGSYTGLYGYLSELRKFKEMLGDSDESVRFTAVRDCRLSFISVDHVIEDSRAIVRAELEAPRQSIYHVSADSVSSVGEFTDYMLKLLGMENQVYIVNEYFDDPTTLERLFAKRVEFFVDYFRKEKRFIRNFGPKRSIPIDELTKFIDAESAL
jgi:nucleoside-diphosphate-sugar epimerase